MKAGSDRDRYRDECSVGNGVMGSGNCGDRDRDRDEREGGIGVMEMGNRDRVKRRGGNAVMEVGKDGDEIGGEKILIWRGEIEI